MSSKTRKSRERLSSDIQAVEQIDGGVDRFLGVGVYSVAEAGRIVSQALGARVGRNNLARWALGRKSRLADYLPILGCSVDAKIGNSHVLNFADLVELFTIAALRREGIKLLAIRYAYERAKGKFGPHPFAMQKYAIDGEGIFTAMGDGTWDMEELATGKVAFAEIVRPLLRNVDYVNSTASTFSPLGSERSVILDPERSFGAPINRESGILTSILYRMHKAGESIERVAGWYDVSVQGVLDAVEYESALTAAA